MLVQIIHDIVYGVVLGIGIAITPVISLYILWEIHTEFKRTTLNKFQA